MEHTCLGKRLLAGLFLLMMALVWAGSSPCVEAGKLYTCLRQQAADSKNVSTSIGQQSDDTIDGLLQEYGDTLWQKRFFLDLHGATAKILHMQGYYSGLGMYVTDDGRIVSAYAQTSTDYEYEQLLSLKKDLDKKGIRLIYVNEPTKYTDDHFFAEQFGVESYSNRNADLLLKRIREAGIHAVDLREALAEDGMHVKDMFYRTDHHWTTASGFWAARKIAEALNQFCGYHIDLSVYDASGYSFTSWKNCWLGEQGRKTGASYVGLDDYTRIKPEFATNLSFKNGGEWTPGTFDDFINEDVYQTNADVYQAPSWHYSYAQTDVVNQDVNDGNVLVLGDSFEQVVIPFLSLGIHKTDSLVLRAYEGSVREYIDAGDYDTVIISYVQTMIGAHDDPASANYKMFTFE